MYTVSETEKFTQQAKEVWNEEERLEFITFLAQNPLCGEVIQQSGGLRKVRWKAKGKGKSKGVRIIYFNLLDDGLIVCTYLYAKNQLENITGSKLKPLKE